MDGPQETIGDEVVLNALEALRYDWEKAYEIKWTDDKWRARRLDGLGGWMEAESAEELRNQILSDYLTKPVLDQPPEA